MPSSPPSTAPLRAGRPRRGALALAGAAVLVPLLGACSGGGGGAAEEGQTPEDVLTAAKTNLDETPGLNLTLSTGELPEGVQGVTGAQGVATRQPAFDGDIGVVVSGFDAEVPVIAVDDVVYAQLPLTSGWQEIEPEDFGAPDPATLLDTETGFSSILPLTEDVEEGESVRGGEDNSEVLTEYTGTVPGEAVTFLIPSTEGDVDAVYTVDDEQRLRRAELTGVFYPDTEAITYVVTFDDYGLETEVTAP
ncbi:hypothetical protein GCM10009737_10700 [Nocardioides lentus]|uniref:LppX_LprAFG lipoprotein n=1 Tax=Nocardioides lentus TaxID=338077 RepID=A0ABP5ADH0_9ACTN